MEKSGIQLGKPFDRNSIGRWNKRITRPESLTKAGSAWDLRQALDANDVEYSGDSHLLTVAPTGSGKGRSVIIPTLLQYEGPLVVTDPKGENYAVTARARMEMGHKVFRLDPFNVMGGSSDALNPLDILDLEGTEIETDSQMIAELLSLKDPKQDDFWHQSAFGLLSGVIAYIASLERTDEENPRTLRKLTRTLNSDDVVYNLAVVLDTIGKKIPPMAYSEISAFLQRADKERSGVLSTANSYLKAFMSEKVLDTLSKSSFSLRDIVAGAPLTLYLIIPPDKLHSHKALLRVWVGTIIRAITSRKVIPEKRTLFILDECAQFGAFSSLESAITLCRGYGLQVWTFWQDLSQIESLYPGQWRTMVNNCAITQFFGARNFMAATESANLIGLDIIDVRELDSDEQIIVRDGKPIKARKLDYLKDEKFDRKFDQNPYYAK